jgi:hypothetical protein
LKDSPTREYCIDNDMESDMSTITHSATINAAKNAT